VIAYRCARCKRPFRTAGAARVHLELLCDGQRPPEPTDDDMKRLRSLKGIELVEAGEAGSPNGTTPRGNAGGREHTARGAGGARRSRGPRRT
jgi:hypothetical protein